jgi:hypothetical protein
MPLNKSKPEFLESADCIMIAENKIPPATSSAKTFGLRK